MVISYETIRNVQRKEKEEKELQKLPENFFPLAKEWLRNKENSAKDATSIIELENAKNLLEDIINRRETKIVIAALSTVRGNPPPEGLTDEETKLFDSIIMLLKNFKSEMQEQIIGCESIAEDKINSAKEAVTAAISKKLRFTADVPEFIDEDMKTYGPFKAGDRAEIPLSVAETLIKRGVAEEE